MVLIILLLRLATIVEKRLRNQHYNIIDISYINKNKYQMNNKC